MMLSFETFSLKVYMVEKVGRRALLQWGYGTMAGWCLALALTLRFSEIVST